MLRTKRHDKRSTGTYTNSATPVAVQARATSTFENLRKETEECAINRIYRQCPTTQYFTGERSII